MDEDKKQPFNTRLPKDTIKLLSNFAEKIGGKIWFIVDKAIKQYIKGGSNDDRPVS